MLKPEFARRAMMALLGLLLAACSSVPLEEPKASIEERGTAPATAQTGPSGVTSTVADSLNDPKSILAQRSIYFDYDSYVVRTEFRPVIEAHAQYLTTHPARKIVLEGNADERGSREYNLALGQKRAEAVRKALAALGVPEGQMEAISFGKEKPRAQGNDEAAWKENRRTDISYR